jgi:tight adherence protein B
VRRPALVLCLVVAAVAIAGPVAAQPSLDLELRSATLETDGRTTLHVSVNRDGTQVEDVPVEAFAVEEDGTPIEGVRAAPLVEEEEPPPSTAVIAFDVSGSVDGEPLEAARAAAVSFVRTVVPRSVDVGLVSFADDADLILEPTDDVDALTAAIGSLEADGRTALFDAVVLATQSLEGRDGERSVVLFTDGEDNESAGTLEGAVDAAIAVDAPVETVALLTDALDPTVLEALPQRTGGGLLEVTDLDGLEAAFEQVADTITDGYVLRYDSNILGDELDLSVRVEHEDASGQLNAVLLNPRLAAEQPPPEPRPVEPGLASTIARPALLLAALAALFVGLAVVFGFLLVPTTERAASRSLRRGLQAVERSNVAPFSAAPLPDSAVGGSAIGRAAIDVIAKAPRPEGYDEGMQREIDRAGWQLRASEFTALRVVGAVLALSLFWALTGSLFIAVLAAAASFFLPKVVLANARTRRHDRFMAQLPDTLQLLSGTLKAGYSVMQALDTVVKEVEEPTASEFQRALTEARLGLPLEVSLEDMASRIGNDDFRWVVVAMNIQRQVGGNLAELLETVAATLRGREQVRGLIRTLSAEGRLSAIILFALPFVVLGFVLLTNPGYLAPLFGNLIGWIMMGSAGFLLIVGAVWIRRLIAIDV